MSTAQGMQLTGATSPPSLHKQPSIALGATPARDAASLPRETAPANPLQAFPDHLVALTTLLDRSLNPRAKLEVTIRPLGAHLLSDELIKSTEAGQYAWRATLWGKSVDFGRFCPRELTEEELEAQKNKKAGKKDAPKAEARPEEETPESRLRDAEDKYKAPSVRWEAEELRQKLSDEAAKREEALKLEEPLPEKKELIRVAAQKPFEFTLEGESLAELEKSLTAGSATLKLERYLSLSEDELAKLRKKLKGPALKDTRTLTCHVALNLKDLQAPGSTRTTLRAPIVQVGDFASEEECSEYKWASAYLKLEIAACGGEFFTPEIQDLFPKVADLSAAAAAPKVSARGPAEEKFNQALMKSLITVSEDYKASIKPDAKEAEEAEKLTQHKRMQLNLKKQQRKTDYVKKFVVGPKYTALKNELAPLVLRIIHDKMEKEMVADKEGLLDADRLISELNIYFQRQLESGINKVVCQTEDWMPHADLIESYFEEKKFKKSFVEDVIGNAPDDMLTKLALEYESLNLKELAEKRFKDLAMLESPVSQKHLTKFMEFYLRQGNYIGAEEIMWRICNSAQASPKSELLLVQACFYLHGGLPTHAFRLIEKLLAQNKFSPLYNTYMAFLHHFYFNRQKLGKKYFAVAQRMRMKDLGLLTSHHKASKDASQKQEKLPELPDKENDEIWLELANYFCHYCFIDLSYKALEMVKNKQAYKVLSLYSSLEFLKGDLDKAEQWLDKMESVGGAHKKAQVYLLKATNAFYREYYYQAEELFYSAIKLDPSVGGFTTMLRLGYIYLRRKSFEDARAIFNIACNMDPKSALSWLGLGVSCHRIGEKHSDTLEQGTERQQAEQEARNRELADKEFQRAESALRMANILDPTNSEVWGYSILLSLKDERKVPQAARLLRHLLNLEIENLDILLEVARPSPDIQRHVQSGSLRRSRARAHPDLQNHRHLRTPALQQNR